MDITVQELKERMDQGDQSFVLIDVREPVEHEEFNVGGHLIPVGEIPGKLEDLSVHQEDEIVVYCRSGRRSGRIQEFMEQAGFKHVRNLAGGMLAWIEAFEQTD